MITDSKYDSWKLHNGIDESIEEPHCNNCGQNEYEELDFADDDWSEYDKRCISCDKRFTNGDLERLAEAQE